MGGPWRDPELAGADDSCSNASEDVSTLHDGKTSLEAGSCSGNSSQSCLDASRHASEALSGSSMAAQEGYTYGLREALASPSTSTCTTPRKMLAGGMADAGAGSSTEAAAGSGTDGGDWAGEEPPERFLCPISYEVMREPVTVRETGVTYDRCSIEQWFFLRNQRSCPATQRMVKHLDLDPEPALQAEVNAWLAAHAEYSHVLQEEEAVQQALFGSVDDAAVAVARALEAVASADVEARGSGLAALCAHLKWRQLPRTLLSTGAYLELLQVVNVGPPAHAALALRALRPLAKTTEGTTTLAEAGFFDSALAALVSSEGDSQLRDAAAGCLLALAANPHHRARLLYSGVVPGLVKMLDSEAELGKERAARLLSKLADVDAHDFWGALRRAGPGLDCVLDLLSAASSRCQAAGLATLLRLAAYEQYRVEIIDAGGAQMPLRLLRSSNASVRERAGALLAMMAQGEASKLKLVEKVGIDPFAALLLSGSSECRRFAAAMLFQLVRGEPDAADSFDEEDGESAPGSRQQAGASSSTLGFSAILRVPAGLFGRTQSQSKVCTAVIEQGGCRVLVGLLGAGDDGVRTRALSLLEGLSATPRVDAGRFLEAGCVAPLVHLLQIPNAQLAELAARTISHLAAASSTVRKAFVDGGAVRALLLMSQHKPLRQAADDALRKLVGLSMYWYMLKRSAMLPVATGGYSLPTNAVSSARQQPQQRPSTP